jgi:hypothetical protein
MRKVFLAATVIAIAAVAPEAQAAPVITTYGTSAAVVAANPVAVLETFATTIAPGLTVVPTRDHRRDAPGNEVVADRVAVVAFVGDQRAGRAERKRHQRVVALAVRRFAAGEVEAERSAEGVTDTMNLTGEPAPRAAKRLFASPPFAPAADTWPRTVVESML